VVRFGEYLERYVTILQYQYGDTITKQQYYDTFMHDGARK